MGIFCAHADTHANIALRRHAQDDRDNVVRQQRPATRGHWGRYSVQLNTGILLVDISQHVSKISAVTDLDIGVANTDFALKGPSEVVRITAPRVNHGADTAGYTCSFANPVVLSGSQIRPRTDAWQKLIDTVTFATDGALYEFHLFWRNATTR